MPYSRRYGVSISAGTQSAVTGTVVFSNSNGVSFGLSTRGLSSIVTMSATGGFSGVNALSIGAGLISSGTAVFSNLNGINFGANGQTITAGLISLSAWNNGLVGNVSLGNTGSSWTIPVSSAAPNLSMQRVEFALPIAATRADLIVSMTAAGSQAGSMTLSAGLYTMTGSTANSISTTSVAVTWNSGTNSTAVSIYGGQSDMRWRSIALGTWNISPGEYLLGVMASMNGPAGTTASLTMYGVRSASVGVPGAGNLSAYFGNGLYSTGTGAFPASVHVSDINQTNSNSTANGQPYVQLAGTF